MGDEDIGFASGGLSTDLGTQDVLWGLIGVGGGWRHRPGFGEPDWGTRVMGLPYCQGPIEGMRDTGLALESEAL